MTDFQLPQLIEPGCIVRGQIYWCDDLDDMSEDMVEVRLPNGILVAAGWSCSEKKYAITASLHGRLIIRPSYTKSAFTAQERVVERIKSYKDRNYFSVSNSDDTDSSTVVLCKNTASGRYAVA